VTESGPVAVGSRSGAARAAEVTVVVPVSERPASLVEIYHEYSGPLKARDEVYEFVFVAEPWYRELTMPVAELAWAGEPVRVYEAGQTVGESALLRQGAAHATGEVIVSLPAYHRVEAMALPELIEAVRGGADMAVARRRPRRDSWLNRLQNRAFHALLGGLAEGRLHDVACGVRAMRKELLGEIPLYGDFFRFLPLLALRRGMEVVEIDAPQHARDRPTRVYQPGVYVRRLIDILGLFFLLRFTEKPLRFFGLVGTALSLAGVAVLILVLAQRLVGQGLANRPLLLLGVLLVVLGFQAVALGLVGEIIVHLRASRHTTYRLKGGRPQRP
jgi:hypothetical protein